MELSSEYCFPQRHLTTANPTDFRQRASSFNDAGSRPARMRHAHRRSAAVSEDLSGVDFSALVKQKGAVSSVFDRSPSRSPVLQTDSDSGNCGFENGSPTSRKGQRVSFVDTQKPHHTPQPIGEACNLELAPPILLSPPTAYQPEPASPCDSLPDSPAKPHRRLSFTKMFSKKKREQYSNNTTPVVGTRSSAEFMPETCTSAVATPPEQYYGFQASPVLDSSRHSFEEPEPPRIDLNEALGCRVPMGYIKSESQPLGHESPFSKKRLSFIDTVAEVENEEDDTKGDVTITASNFDRHASPSRNDLSPARTPQLDSIRAVDKLAIMDPIESPSILVAKTSEDSFACSYSSSSSLAIEKAQDKPRRSRHHRRRRSLAALFGRSSAN